MLSSLPSEKRFFKTTLVVTVPSGAIVRSVVVRVARIDGGLATSNGSSKQPEGKKRRRGWLDPTTREMKVDQFWIEPWLARLQLKLKYQL